MGLNDNRIFFKGNPWPEGHRIKEFVWSARIRGEDVWFDMHLKTEDYYSERHIDDDEETDYPSGWEAPAVWGNYHACTLSTNYWHDGGFKVCPLETYSPNFLDGLELAVDPDPGSVDDWDDLAFHIYLLGHDSVAKHRFRFERIGNTNAFDIIWSGKIAQAYIGHYEYTHEFATVISGINFPELQTKSA